MLVLGISGSFSGEYMDLVPGISGGFFHDATACLIRDGALVAAVEEERLNRIKKTTKFPTNAIRSCLLKIGAGADDIDAIGYYFSEGMVDRTLGELYVRHPHLPIRSARDFINDHFIKEFDVAPSVDRLIFAEHHKAHGLSCFANSGMDNALVVVMDGRGERHSTTVFRGSSGRLVPLATYDVSKSLGYFYASAITLLGYGLGDEYKIMGLAPYGDKEVYGDFFRSLYDLKDHGDYTLRPISARLLSRGFIPRRKGEDFSRQHIDFAAGVQNMLEILAMHVITYWAGQSGLTNLCFAGGVAHNSSLNGRILQSGVFREVFVHPASHDAGAAEGAAIYAAQSLNADEAAGAPRRMRTASLGPELGTSVSIKEEIAAWSDLVDYEEPTDIIDRTARLLADGAVIGWAQGCSEFGPRALGNRSILADARPSNNKERINSMVKMREAYRPFAPVITREATTDYIDLPETRANYDFMSFVVQVRDNQRKNLGAVTHVDGSARVQIVDSVSSQRFHQLVARFGELTGTPVLLNTSFNNNVEPIVQSVHDALTCFLTTGLDFLVLEDFLVSRRVAGAPPLDNMILGLRPMTRIVKRRQLVGSGEYIVSHEAFLDFVKGERVEVSSEVFAILEQADGSRTLAHLAECVGGLTQYIRTEIHELWQKRLFSLQPK